VDWSPISSLFCCDFLCIRHLSHNESLHWLTNRLLVTTWIQSVLWEIRRNSLFCKWHVLYIGNRNRHTHRSNSSLLKSSSLLSMDTVYSTFTSVSVFMSFNKPMIIRSDHKKHDVGVIRKLWFTGSREIWRTINKIHKNQVHKFFSVNFDLWFTFFHSSKITPAPKISRKFQ
jgi:hypothetical protein